MMMPTATAGKQQRCTSVVQGVVRTMLHFLAGLSTTPGDAGGVAGASSPETDLYVDLDPRELRRELDIGLGCFSTACVNI
jgi:hypothetical protein